MSEREEMVERVALALHTWNWNLSRWPLPPTKKPAPKKVLPIWCSAARSTIHALETAGYVIVKRTLLTGGKE